jgi:hypothetical protein
VITSRRLPNQNSVYISFPPTYELHVQPIIMSSILLKFFVHFLFSTYQLYVQPITTSSWAILGAIYVILCEIWDYHGAEGDDVLWSLPPCRLAGRCQCFVETLSQSSGLYWRCQEMEGFIESEEEKAEGKRTILSHSSSLFGPFPQPSLPLALHKFLNFLASQLQPWK